MSTTSTSPFEPKHPVVTVDTAGMALTPVSDPNSTGTDLQGMPDPKGTTAGEQIRDQDGLSNDPVNGSGVEGEVDVWQSRYSQRNFIGRIAFRTVLSLVWMGLAIYTWSFRHVSLHYVCWASLAIVGLLWLALFMRMVQAHYSHYYRLTNRRLFVSTGVVNRRRDMMELLMVQDVFSRQQSLLERWLNLGTVVVVPSEKTLPTFYLTGVDDPKAVLDLIWHHARAERDQRSVKVEEI